MIESKGHKITPINGDLAVSRNAEIGRDVDIQGKARVAGSLKVEGFLDAPHIKGAAKGLFNSVEELAKEYPDPRPGWFAIVLDATNKEKGILYKAENKVWVATTDEAKPYEFIQDSINMFASKNELIDTKEGLETAINTTAEELADTITNIKGDALQYNKIGFSVYADKIELYAKNISDNDVRYDKIPAATAEKAGVMSAEDKKNLDSLIIKSITWNNDTDPSNMNEFVVAGVYDIKGERTRDKDNLPILNTGGGHSFNARLTVLDSSISGSGKDDDKCITQVLSFSNRLGQGEVYIRTGKGSSLNNLTWEKWSTLQRNVNVGSLNSKGDLRNYIDNGIYSGVFRYGSSNNDLRTFVMVVINDYAIGLSPRRVSQFLYSIDKATGKVSYETQTCEDETWKGWEILNKGEIDSMISVAVDNAIKGIIADAPEAFDTLKEIADWIANDETGTVALANTVSANTKAINTEATRAKEAEEEISQNAIASDSIGYSTTTTDVSLEFETLDGKSHGSVTFPSATTEKAGVMSAEDKENVVYSTKNTVAFCADRLINSYIKELYISGENAAEQGFYIERIIRNANNTCVVAVYSADKSKTLYFESLEKVPYGYFKVSTGGYTLEAVINFDKVTERWGDHVCDATTGKLLESSFDINSSPTIKAIHLHENVRNELSSEITKIDATISSNDVVAIKGKYLQYHDGSISPDYADGYYSDFYPVVSGCRVSYSGQASRNAAACAFYDVDKKWISSYPVPRLESLTVLDNVTVEAIPENARFIRFGSVYRSFSAKILPANLVTLKELDEVVAKKTIRNPIYNKSVDWIGASHMQGIVSGVHTGGFASIIADRNSMTSVNHGIGGTTMAVRADRTNSFVERIETYSKDVDYVIVMGGANDTVSVPIGTITSGYAAELDKTTFYGACEWMCKYIMENYSDKKYGLIVPFHISSTKLSGEYGDAIVAVCKKWGMPCLDLRCEAGFNIANIDLRRIYGAYVGGVAQYDSTKGYNLDEQVKYEGVLYKSDAVIPAPAGDFDASKWTRQQSEGASDYDDWHCNVLGYRKLADKVEAWMRTL